MLNIIVTQNQQAISNVQHVTTSLLFYIKVKEHVSNFLNKELLNMKKKKLHIIYIINVLLICIALMKLLNSYLFLHLYNLIVTMKLLHYLQMYTLTKNNIHINIR